MQKQTNHQNALNHISDLYSRFEKQGLTGKRLTNAVAGVLLDEIRTSADEVIVNQSATGVIKFKATVKFFEENSSQLTSNLRKEFSESLARLGAALVVFTTSSRSRELIAKQLPSIFSAAGKFDRESFKTTAEAIVSTLPEKSRYGFSNQPKIDHARAVINNAIGLDVPAR